MEKILWDAIEFNFVVDIFIKLIIQLFARVCIILNWKILDTTNVLYVAVWFYFKFPWYLEKSPYTKIKNGVKLSMIHLRLFKQ